MCDPVLISTFYFPNTELNRVLWAIIILWWRAWGPESVSRLPRITWWNSAKGTAPSGTPTEPSIVWQREGSCIRPPWCPGLHRLSPDFENATQQRPGWVVGNWWIPAEFEQWDLTEHLRKKKDGEDRQNTIVQTKSELKKKKKLATTNIPQLSNLDQNENLDNGKVCQ